MVITPANFYNGAYGPSSKSVESKDFTSMLPNEKTEFKIFLLKHLNIGSQDSLETMSIWMKEKKIRTNLIDELNTAKSQIKNYPENLDLIKTYNDCSQRMKTFIEGL